MDGLDDIALFAEIVAAGGLAAAEARTGLPRSTLSRRLARLEASLGVALAKRSPQGFSLTASGQSFYQDCAAALARIDAARAAMRATQSRPAGLVRVTAPSALVHGFLAAEVPAFLHRHPQTRVAIHVDGAKLDLGRETFDIAFRVGDACGDGQVARLVFEEREALYASPDWLAQNGPVGQPRDLEGRAAVLCARRPPGAATATWTLAGTEVTLRAVLEVNDPIASRTAVESGLGVARLPRFVGEPGVRAGRLVRILPDWTSASIPVRAVLPQKPSAAARALLGHVTEAARRRWRDRS